MPNPPTDAPTFPPAGDEPPPACGRCRDTGSTLIEVAPRAYLCASCRATPTGYEAFVTSSHPHPLIGRDRWAAWRELMNGNGNAFAVGGAGDGGVVVLGWDFLSRPLGRKEVANLVAWLLMVSGVTVAELEPICRAQGLSLSLVPALERAAIYCDSCGGELVGSPPRSGVRPTTALVCASCGGPYPPVSR